MVLVYLALVGLIEAFAERDVITDVLTLGQLMLATVTLIAGYRAAIAPRGVAPPSAGLRLACGVLAGAIAGAALGLLIMLGYSPIDLQTVFVRLSPDLLEFLSFGQPAPVGAAMQIGLNAVVGVLGAGLLVLPHRLRRSVIAGLIGVALASMLEPYVGPRMDQLNLDDMAELIWRQSGLTIPATIVIFVGGGRHRCRLGPDPPPHQPAPGGHAAGAAADGPLLDLHGHRLPGADPAAGQRPVHQPGAGAGRPLPAARVWA